MTEDVLVERLTRADAEPEQVSKQQRRGGRRLCDDCCVQPDQRLLTATPMSGVDAATAARSVTPCASIQG